MKINASIIVELAKDEDRTFIDSIRENAGSYLLELSLRAADPNFREKDEIWKRDNDFSLPDPHFERENPRYLAWLAEQKEKEKNLQRKVDEPKRNLTHRVEKSSSDTIDALDLSGVPIDDIPRYLGMD